MATKKVEVNSANTPVEPGETQASWILRGLKDSLAPSKSHPFIRYVCHVFHHASLVRLQHSSQESMPYDDISDPCYDKMLEILDSIEQESYASHGSPILDFDIKISQNDAERTLEFHDDQFME